MKSIRLLSLLCALFIAGSISAQKIVVKSGSLKDLKGATSIKTVYDYSNLGVGDFSNEDDYIAKRMEESEKNKPGSGPAWKEKWFADREKQYEPKFEELLGKYLPDVKIGKDVESDIILNVHTTFIEPGFNVGVMRRPAFTNLTFTFTKAGSEIAVVEMLKSPGADAMGFDFDAAYRIQESYAKAGKSLSSYIKKQTK